MRRSKAIATTPCGSLPASMRGRSRCAAQRRLRLLK